MKQTMKIITFMLIVMLSICTISCANKATQTGLWENAAYLSDTTLGNGANVVKVELVTEERSIMFTVKTDKATLGEALFENKLVNDALFFDTFNGIKADWEKDKAYWSFYVDGEAALYGIGDAKAVTSGSPSYKIVYTK